MKRKVRNYESALRTEAAAETRERILRAGRKLLIERGYVAMTMQAVADEADVALDTIYASVGKKPALVELLFETAISNTDHAIVAEERDYVQRMRSSSSAREKLAIYASAVVAIQSRLAPLVHAVEIAGQAAPELAAIWKAISERRARNMKLLAADLIATGETRTDLAADEIADVIWVMSSPQHYLMFVEHRGWSKKQLEGWLADTWVRLFLR